MPNPVITPMWGPNVDYTVTDSDFLAVDARFSNLISEPGQIEVSVPVGATVHVVRSPVGWSDAGSLLRDAGGWVAGPVLLGNWTVTLTPGVAPTDPATIEVSNPDGTAASGLLRLLISDLGGGACGIFLSGGFVSIDRLLADPSIVNPQVTSGPVEELDAVHIAATVLPTVEANPAPVIPLTALPALVSRWAPEPDNPLAVPDFISAGATATFTAPAVYDNTSLDFRITSAYDFDSTGTLTPGDPGQEEVLNVPIATVGFGMLLVLDRSGSMGSSLGGGTNKWDATVQAAHAWLDLFRSFRTGSQHRAGILTFEHDTGTWTLSSSSDVTLRNPQNAAAAGAMGTMPSYGDHTVLNLGDPETCTPIGDGLVKGLEVLQSTLVPGNKAGMVLLTDGYENAGRVTIRSVAGPAASTFDVERESPGLSFGNDLVGDRLFAVAVGATVDEDRLNDLASQLGRGYYRITANVKEILPSFAEMLGEVLDAHQILPTSLTDPDAAPHAIFFEISTGEQRASFLVPWTSATHNLRVAWRPQGSNGAFTLLDPGHAAVVGYWRRQFHGVMTVDLGVLTGNGVPPATEWRIQYLDAGNAALPLTDADILGMVDLKTKAEIRFDKRAYFTGDPIRITCRIRTGGQVVTGATVKVDVAGPGEGLGTFLATNAPLYLRHIASSKEKLDLTHGVAVGGAPVSSPQGDPDQGKGLMFKTLLSLKNLDALPVTTPPAFHLHDDGTHGDGIPSDGDYSNQFTATSKEGSYTFRFRIEGTLADGSRFSRLFVRSTWVGVRPDAVATTMVWTSLGTLPNGLTGQTLTFTPMSSSGERLGPFREDVIRLDVSYGTAHGTLIDNLDGSYTQQIHHPTGQDPVVRIEVYGTPLLPTGPTLGKGGRGCLPRWLRVIFALFRRIFQ